MQPISRKAAKDGQKATVKVDMLIINGHNFTVDTVHMLPQPLKPAEVATLFVSENPRAFLVSSLLSQVFLRRNLLLMHMSILMSRSIFKNNNVKLEMTIV